LVRQAPMIVILFFFAMVFGVWWMLPDYHVPNTNRFEAAEFKHFLSATLLIPLGLMWRRFSWRGFRWVLGPFEKLAPISYALYVFHMPMIVALMAVADRPGTPAFLRTPAAFLVLLLGAVALFSWLMEVQVQRVINRLTGPLLSPRRSTDS
jgi:peptidoglycan/LPS O-acetylase OafA/YrhL